MFNFSFEKTAEEIKVRANEKITALNAKIEERQRRIATLRSEHSIDDAALVQLLTAARRQAHATSYSYSSSNASVGGSKMEERTIGAGVVNNLLTESDFIEADRANVKQLGAIVRNLRPLERSTTTTGAKYQDNAFRLTYEELEFLGF